MQKQKMSDNTITEQILNKIRAAGIEVVTDKDEFERILKEKQTLQKLSCSSVNK